MRQDKTVILTGASGYYRFRIFLDRFLKSHGASPVLEFADVDRALEFAEDRLLKEIHAEGRSVEAIPLEEQPLCRHFDDDELELLRSTLDEETYEAGELVCKEGQLADKVYFLTSGRVGASVRLGPNRRSRLSASAAGWAFGESALFKHHTRTADIIADTRVQVYSLKPEKLWGMEDPLATRVKLKLLSNLSETSMDRMGRMNQEIRTLTR